MKYTVKNMLSLLTCLLALISFSCTEVPDYSELKVNVSPPDAGMIYRELAGSEYEKGTVVELEAVASSLDYSFARWTGDVWGDRRDSSASIYIEMDRSKTVTAHFERMYTLTTDVNPTVGGNVYCGSIFLSCSQSYRAGTQVTVIARPSTGYSLSRWSGASTSTRDTITITMYNNMTLTANFVIVPTSAPTGVTATANSSSSITISWSSVSNASGYYVYRSESVNGTFYQIGQVTGISYTDTGLLSNRQYYYKVAAHGNGVTAAQSSAVSATTQSQSSYY